jgi:hypothetical protein
MSRATRRVLAALLALSAVPYIPGLVWTFSDGGQDVAFHLVNGLLWGAPIVLFAAAAVLLARRNLRRSTWPVVTIGAAALATVLAIGYVADWVQFGVWPDWSATLFIVGAAYLLGLALWVVTRARSHVAA